ncbi:MAG: cytochrome P450 [Pseudonocardiaceae bacterium]
MTVTTSVAHRAPVADGSFLLGSAQQLRRDVLGAAEQAFRQYGDVVEFRAGPPGMRVKMYMLFHPDAAHRVLAGAAGNYRKDNIFYGEVRGAFGDGLLTSQDDDWLRQKRFLQPLFTHRRISGYAEAMGEEVADLLANWHSRRPHAVDLHEEMTRLTMRIVGRILFGDDVSRALLAVRQSFEPLGEAVRRRSFSPVRLPRSWPTPVNRRLVTAQKALYGVCDEIIARRRAASDRGTDLLGLLLDARDQGHALSDSEVRDQVLIFLLAGHETTSTALTFALHLLGQHPDLQRQIRAEADALGGMPTAADAPALVQTTMALKEAMRLYPSAPMLGRRAVTDDEICGYRIPAGSDVVLVPWVIHRHPQFWDEPTRFEPQRFTPERDKGRHRYAWMPFGGGPRGCIGQHFSMLEASIALASLVREFEFETPSGEPRYTNHITLRPTHAVTSRLTPRRH